MSSEKVEIEVLFQQLARAHADHNANAIFEAYAPDAVIYDLAPPLGRRGMNRDSVAAWLAGWEGPILIEAYSDRCARRQSYRRGRLGVHVSVQQNARAPRR